MKDILRDYTELFQRQRKNLRRYTAMLLVLALTTTLFVNWQLHGVGISMTAEYQCGMEEHEHTAACYEKVLTCGYTEGEPEDWNVNPTPDDWQIDPGFGLGVATYAMPEEPEYEEQTVTEMVEEPHVHTDECYEERQVLDCLEEEHVHGDDCFDPETSELICDKFEHTHDESCYTTERELVCGLEEGELVETPVETVVLVPVEKEAPAAVQTYEAPQAKPVAATPTHVHTDACYTEVLTCTKPEHHHTVECLSDPMEDVESEADWLAKTDTTLTGEWGKDLVTVAKSQLGYQESVKNFRLDTDDGETVRGYSRYGAWYGNKYGEWDVMFLSYCLHYANVPSTVIPQRAGVLALRSDLRDSDLLVEADGMAAMPGDVVIYNNVVTETVAKDETYDDSFSDSTADVDPDPDDPYGIALYSAYQPRPVVVDDSDLVQVGQTGTVETETRDVSIETVGIVTEVNEDAGTLTVISGDVNGKVAEVQVSASDVTDVILVNAAYYAYAGEKADYDVDIPEDDGSDFPCRVLKIAAATGVATYANVKSMNQYIKGLQVQVATGFDSNGTPSNWKTLGPGETVKPNDTIRVTLNYAIDGDVNAQNREVKYKLPAGITLLDDEAHSGEILWYNPNTKQKEVVGKYEIKGDEVTFTYNEDFKALGGYFAGDFTFKATTSLDSNKTEETIDFGGTDHTLTIKREEKTYDLTVKKNVDKNEYGQDKTVLSADKKKVTISYTVVANTNNGTDGSVTLKDYLGDCLGTPSYVETSVKLIKVAADGTETDVTTVNKDKLTFNAKTGIKYTGLPALNAGERYELRYDVEAPVQDGKYTVSNKAQGSDKNNVSEDSKTVTVTDSDISTIIKKSADKYDADTRTITWKIEVRNPYNTDMAGKQIKDIMESLPKGSEVVGNVEVHEGWWNDSTKDVMSAEDFKNAGYTYTFPSNRPNFTHNDLYCMFIKTKMPSTVKPGDVVTNKASFDDSTGQGDATIGNRNEEIKKTYNSKDDLSNGMQQLSWSSSVTVPSTWSSVTLTDTIQNADVSGETKTGSHYALLGQLKKELESGLELTLFEGGSITPATASASDVTFTYRYWGEDGSEIDAETADENTHVVKFSVTATCKDGKTVDATYLKLNNYHTIADITDAAGGESWHFQNHIESGNLSTDAEYTYTKPKDAAFEKRVYKDSGYNHVMAEGESIDYTNLENGKLYYEVILPITAETSGDLVVTDLLPAGAKLVEGSVVAGTLDYNADGTIRYHNWINPQVGPWNKQYVFKDHITCTETQQGDSVQLTITLEDKDPGYKAGYTGNGYAISIRYAIDLSDDMASDMSVSKVYTNSALWNKSTEPASTTTTVTRKFEKLDKVGTTIESTEEDESKRITTKVHYSVIINPGSERLMDGNNLTLTDTLSFEPGDGCSAELDLTSVKMCGVKLGTDGKPTKDEDNLISSNRYSTSYDDSSYTLTVTVPDEMACVLEYDYAIRYPADTVVKVKNHAHLSGGFDKWDEEYVRKYSSAANVRFTQYTLYKMDANDSTHLLRGATFTLTRWNGTEFEKVFDLTTDENGRIYIELLGTYEQKEKFVNESEAQLLPNKIYRLVETKAPDGYTLTQTPRYLLWGEFSTTTKNDAFKAANNGSTSSIQDTEFNVNLDANAKNLRYYPNGESGSAYVSNTASAVSVVKRWLDKDGSTELLPEQVDKSYTATVQLKRKVYKNGAFQKDVEVERTERGDAVVVLNKNNSWSYEWKNLPLTDSADSSITYTYFVEETDCSGSFKYDLDNSGITGGTITLYNQVPGSDGFELPSTGGTGTTPFTAVGGAMALAALVCGACRKRRRERRTD